MLTRNAQIILYACALAGNAAAQSGSYRPERVPVDSIKHVFAINPRDVRPNVSPVIQPLTPAVKQQLTAFLNGLPRFPDYEYSGCHDRAHAVWLLMPASLRQHTAKIWLLSPERTTAAVMGRIGLRENQPGNGPQVGWGYHVALAFVEGGQTLVFDAALAPQGLITEEQWYAKMKIPRYSLSTLVRGEGHLFNFGDSGTWSPFNDTFNGNWHTYSTTTNPIPTALARDSVGSAILNGNACPAMMPIIGDANRLERWLTTHTDSIPAQCAHLKTTFTSQRQWWTQRLPLQ